MERLEREYEERLIALEEWNALLQETADKHSAKLDTGALNLRKSVDTMGQLLDSMERQRGEINQPLIANLDPNAIERVGGGRTFLSPFTPMVHQLRKSFDKEELAMLAFDAGINMEDVGGSGLLDICRRLVAHAKRRNKLDDLLAMAAKERPDVDWSKLRVAPDEMDSGEHRL